MTWSEDLASLQKKNVKWDVVKSSMATCKKYLIINIPRITENFKELPVINCTFPIKWTDKIVKISNLQFTFIEMLFDLLS
jgi:hypothetical protein